MRSPARTGLAAIIVAVALALSACQSQAAPPSNTDDELSPLVAGALPCPYGIYQNILEGHAAPVDQLDKFEGPAGFPHLTEGYPASCVFRYHDPGATSVQAYYIGMGSKFVLEMAKRLKKYGYTLVGSNNDLPNEWSLNGLELFVDPHYAGDLSVPHTTFDQDFVTIVVVG